MIGLDTKAVLRYIMQDDPRQSPKATPLGAWDQWPTTKARMSTAERCGRMGCKLPTNNRRFSHACGPCGVVTMMRDMA